MLDCLVSLIQLIHEQFDTKHKEYGIPLFGDIEGYEQPIFIYKPFDPSKYKCNKTPVEHLKRQRIIEFKRCTSCSLQMYGPKNCRWDDICNCSTRVTCIPSYS